VEDGGIAGLRYAVDTFYGALEADFLRFYAVDLRAVLWGEHAWGVRRLVALVRGLPADSAFASAISAEESSTPTPAPDRPAPATPAEIAAFFPIGPPG